MAQNAEPIYGVVLEVVGGQTPRPASQVMYTTEINIPEGGTIVIQNDEPQCPRWPDSVNIVPHPPGKPVFGMRVDGVIVMNYQEYPDLFNCGSATPTPPEPPVDPTFPDFFT